MTAEWAAGDPKVMEPEKIEGWAWYSIDDLPKPLFGATKNYAEAYRSGKTYFND